MKTRKPSDYKLRRALDTTATLRAYLYTMAGEGRREATYERLLQMELRRPNSRRSVVHKLFTLRWAATKARAWAEMEQRL